MKFFKKPWIHLVAFGAFPQISLLTINFVELNISDGYRSILVGLLLAGVTFLIVVQSIKNNEKAALITSLSIIIFFSYGHIFNVMSKLIPLRKDQPYLLIAFIIIIGLLGYTIKRTDLHTESLTLVFNFVSVIAIIIPFYRVIFLEYSAARTISKFEGVPEEDGLYQFQGDQPLPDVYYIILDAYGRDDTLAQEFLLDNTPFLTSLENYGFYIANCSMSNYGVTALSLSSSLNLNYIEALADLPTFRMGYPKSAVDFIKNSAIRHIFQKTGYQIVAFETGYKWTQIEDADFYFAPPNESFFFGRINKFESLLLDTTLLSGFLKQNIDFLNELDSSIDPHEIHRDRVLYVLEQLKEVPKIPGPKFVFAHIGSPHFPFIFSSNGSKNINPNANIAYSEQVAYLNTRMDEVIKEILANSNTPPIILIQGDHGPHTESVIEHMKILNAYYFPNDGEIALYPEASPVNNFRIILNYYFGADLPILEDVSFVSPPEDDTILYSVTDNRELCK